MVGDEYLNYTSDQSIGPGLTTQMHIATIKYSGAMFSFSFFNNTDT